MDCMRLIVWGLDYLLTSGETKDLGRGRVHTTEKPIHNKVIWEYDRGEVTLICILNLFAEAMRH